MKCFKCHGELESAVEIINYKGRSAYINVMKCNQCGESYSKIDDVDKARIQLNSSFLERIKSFFKSKSNFEKIILNGKVL